MTTPPPLASTVPMLLTLFLVAHALGLATSLAALMSTRTPQGTLAWLLALNTLPVLAVPGYWVLGRRRFEGYLVSRRGQDSRLRDVLDRKMEGIRPFRHPFPPDERGGLAGASER